MRYLLNSLYYKQILMNRVINVGYRYSTLSVNYFIQDALITSKCCSSPKIVMLSNESIKLLRFSLVLFLSLQSVVPVFLLCSSVICKKSTLTDTLKTISTFSPYDTSAYVTPCRFSYRYIQKTMTVQRSSTQPV